MPRTNGVYTLPPVSIVELGMDVLPQQHNVPLQDIAQALTNSLPRDGSAAMTGDLPMGGRKITGLGNGTSPQDAAAFGQIPVLSEFVKSMSSLSMVADRVIYSLNTTTAAMAVCTAYGRSLWGAADAAAARNTLGVTGNSQAVWNAGTDTKESLISAAKLDDTIKPMSLGWGAGWQDVRSIRSGNTNYTNTLGRPIEVRITLIGAAGLSSSLRVGIVEVQDNLNPVSGQYYTFSAIIPPNATYRLVLNGAITIHRWVELQ